MFYHINLESYISSRSSCSNDVGLKVCSCQLALFFYLGSNLILTSGLQAVCFEIITIRRGGEFELFEFLLRFVDSSVKLKLGGSLIKVTDILLFIFVGWAHRLCVGRLGSAGSGFRLC